MLNTSQEGMDKAGVGESRAGKEGIYRDSDRHGCARASRHGEHAADAV